MLEVLIRSGIATMVALIGAGVAIATGLAPRRLTALVGAAAGALLAVSLVSLIPESLRFIGLPQALVAVVSGYAVFYIIGRYVFPICPACALSEMNGHTIHRLQSALWMFAVVLTLHALMDGVALAAGHEAHGESDLPLQFAVALHKLPEGLALAAVLLQAGHNVRSTLFWTFGIEVMTIAGGLMGSLLLPSIPLFWVGLVMAHVAGVFLYLVLHAMLGGTRTRDRASQMGYGTLGFGAASLLLYSVQRFHLH